MLILNGLQKGEKRGLTPGPLSKGEVRVTGCNSLFIMCLSIEKEAPTGQNTSE